MLIVSAINFSKKTQKLFVTYKCNKKVNKMQCLIKIRLSDVISAQPSNETIDEHVSEV